MAGFGFVRRLITYDENLLSTQQWKNWRVLGVHCYLTQASTTAIPLDMDAFQLSPKLDCMTCIASSTAIPPWFSLNSNFPLWPGWHKASKVIFRVPSSNHLLGLVASCPLVIISWHYFSANYFQIHCQGRPLYRASLRRFSKRTYFIYLILKS